MITVFGEGRGFRVVWLLEEMGLPYRPRPVDLLAGVEKDTEFLAINPAGFIPAIQDGDVTMVESIAIMEYLMARYGPTPLAPEPHDPTFPAFQQILRDRKRETVGILGDKESVRFDRAARHGVFDQRALRAAIGEEIRRREGAILRLQRHVLLQTAPVEQQSAGYAAQRLYQ